MLGRSLKTTVRDRVEKQAGRLLVRLPERVVTRLGGATTPVDGQKLDPRVQFAVRMIEASSRPMHELTVPEARREYHGLREVFDEPPPPGVDVQHSMMTLPGRSLRYRIYRPDTYGGRRGALVFYHGGGGVIGDLDTHDGPCRWLCALARCTLISVDYRLAPEHPFPAGVEDAIDSFRWVRHNAARLGIEAHRIAVGGDSMGGNLAAVTCHAVQGDDAPTPRFQLLVYPTTDSSRTTESRRLFADGYLLSGDLIRWFSSTYLAGADVNDRRISPLLHDAFDGLPPAFIATAGFDPLRDEGEAYARKLEEAGVDVALRRYEGQVHGFFQMTAIPSARATMVEMATALQKGLRDT
jgi:acetyl esterase